MKNITFTLFYASWCGYCKRFMPDWEKFKQKVASMKQKLNDKGIFVTILEYESEMKDKMRENKIKQYPTIKVKIEEDYEGKKASKEINDHLEILCNDSDNLMLEYFFSNKCKHCVNFAPEWENIKKICKGEIKIKEYEESKSIEIMDKRDIEGYPTLRISREITVKEDRDIPKLLGYIDKDIFGLQTGGGDYYYQKYLKYKKKYEELKNKQR